MDYYNREIIVIANDSDIKSVRLESAEHGYRQTIITSDATPLLRMDQFLAGYYINTVMMKYE